MRRKPKIKEAVGAEATAGDETFDATDSIPDADRRSRKIQTLNQYFSSHSTPYIVAYVRVSCDYPKWQQWAEEQKLAIAEEAAKYGAKVARCFVEIQKRDLFKPNDRPKLVKAVTWAGEMKTVVVAKDVTRFVGYHNQHKMPSSKRLKRFLHYYPDASFAVACNVEDIRTMRTKRGHRNSGNRGGRPKKVETKRQRRERLIEQVVEMRKFGISWGKISEWTGVSRSTLQGWLPGLIIL